MRKINILILFTFCFLSAVSSENVIKIGTATIRQDTNSITLIHGNRTNMLERSDSCLDYTYIITTPFIKYDGCNGVPRLKDEDGIKYKCKGLSPIPWDRSIRKSDFVLFPLFDKKPTCLGILTGMAGCSGGSSQNLTFLDTASNRHLELATQDMNDPVWIMGKGHPIGFKTFNYNYVAGHALSLGLKPRLKMIYSLVDGAFVPDETLKMAEIKQCYSNISFTAQEKNELGKTDWMEMDREVAEKLLDAIQYGTILGKQDEVNSLLAIVTPELRKEIKESFIATSADDKIVSRIKDALEKDDAMAFADMVKYPIYVGVNGQHSVIETPKQFADHYRDIISPGFKKKVIDSIPGDIWRKPDALAIGPGYIWLNDDKIITINNGGAGFPIFQNSQGRITVVPEGLTDYRIFINRIVSDPSSDFKQSDCVIEYTLYKADINNDNETEFILTYTAEGTAHFTGIEGVWKESSGKFIRLPFEKAVAKSLDNNNPDFEWRHIMTYLAIPFLVIKDGTVYFGFDDNEYYVWKGDNINRKDLTRPN